MQSLASSNGVVGQESLYLVPPGKHMAKMSEIREPGLSIGHGRGPEKGRIPQLTYISVICFFHGGIFELFELAFSVLD